MSTVRAVLRFIARNAKRLAVTIAGFVVIAVGLVLSLPGIPGPGIAIAFGGLAILATEYVWAQRALEKAKERARRVSQRVMRRKPVAPGDPPARPAGTTAEDPSV